MRTALALAITLLSWPAAAAPPSTIITGKVLGSDGRPMPVAHVRVRLPGARKHLAETTAGKDGNFRIEAPSGGLLLASFQAPGHERERVPLAVDGKPLVVEVRLRGLGYLPEIRAPRLMGDFNDFSFDTARPMKLGKDGVFSLEIATDKPTVSYQVVGLVGEDRSVDGPQADSFDRDTDGDYISIVKASGGKVRIVLDPKQLHRGGKSQITASQPRAARLARAYRDTEAADQKLEQRISALMAGAGAKGIDATAAFKELDAASAELAARADKEADPLVRDVLLHGALRLRLSHRSGAGPEVLAFAKAVLGRLAPTSPAWGLDPGLAGRAAAALGVVEGDRYLDRLLAAQPDRALAGQVLLSGIQSARFERRDADLRRLYARFMKDYSDLDIAILVKRFSPERHVSQGQPVPAFSVSALDKGAAISDASLKGKPYLLHFWATWCKPCVAEMEHIHALHGRFGKKGFAIVSLSMDQSADDVRAFRKGKWKMPWQNAFIENGLESELAQRFDVIGIPRLVLVDAAGRVLATEEELRSPGALEQIVGALIK